MKRKSILGLTLAVVMMITSLPVMGAEETVQKNELSILKGTSVQLETLNAEDVTYVFTSDDERVAAVDEKGQISHRK